METIEKKVKINNKSVRFSEAPWYSPGIEAVVGGAGGIGSWLSIFLARQEVNLHIFDMDHVDETNIGGQIHSNHHIGMSKVEALAETINNYTTCYPDIYNEPYNTNSLILPVMFSAFDNMETRRLMFEKWAKQENRLVFIDGRLLAESGQVYTVTKGREDLYRATLFDDKHVAEQPCSFKATSHCGAMIASYMTACFNNVVANDKNKNDDRDTPFKLTFDLPIFLFNTYEK